MTCRSYHKRPAPAVNEHLHDIVLSRYLAHDIHPCVAVILAYEDATGTGTAASSRVPALNRLETRIRTEAA